MHDALVGILISLAAVMALVVGVWLWIRRNVKEIQGQKRPR